jgi:hypothetical protein
MSFDRKDYQSVFDFASVVWKIPASDDYYFRVEYKETFRTVSLAKWAEYIMDSCENVIGQQVRPDR